MIRIAILSLALMFVAPPVSGAQERASRLIVVTVDGLRWQELFTGIDAELMTLREAGVKRVADHALMKSLWTTDSSERRKRLFPFFWGGFSEQNMDLYISV